MKESKESPGGVRLDSKPKPEAKPEDKKTEAPEAIPQEKGPEDVIKRFETETESMKGKEQALAAQIRDKKEVKKVNEEIKVAGLERINAKIDQDIAGLEKNRGALEREIARREPSQKEKGLQTEIQEVDADIQALREKKKDADRLRVPSPLLNGIKRDIETLENRKKSMLEQLQAVKLERIQKYQKKEEGLEKAERKKEAVKARSTRLKEEAGRVLRHEAERKEKKRKPEIKEAVEGKPRLGWLEKAFQRTAPFGIYAYIQERRAAKEAGRIMARQIEFARKQLLSIMRQEGKYSGFKSVRAIEAEIQRMKKEANRGREKANLKELYDIREGLGKEAVDRNREAINQIVGGAAKLLTKKLEQVRSKFGEWIHLDEGRLEAFKDELRKRLIKEMDNQLVADAKHYARIVRESLDPRYWETDTHRILRGTAEAAVLAGET